MSFANKLNQFNDWVSHGLTDAGRAVGLPVDPKPKPVPEGGWSSDPTIMMHQIKMQNDPAYRQKFEDEQNGRKWTQHFADPKGAYSPEEKLAFEIATQNGRPAYWQEYVDQAKQRMIEQENNKWKGDVQGFVDKWRTDPSMSDDYAQRAIGDAETRARRNADLSGVKGGLSVLNSQLAYNDVYGKIHDARKGQNDAFALQGEGLLGTDINNRANALNQLTMLQKQIDAQTAGQDKAQQYQAAQQKYQNDLSTAQGLGMVGGGLLGSLPGIFTMNPALAIGGASAGASLGGGLAGQFAGPKPPAYKAPSSGSSGRMSY